MEAKDEVTEEAGAEHVFDREAAPVVESCAAETQRDAIHAPVWEAVCGDTDADGLMNELREMAQCSATCGPLPVTARPPRHRRCRRGLCREWVQKKEASR